MKEKKIVHIVGNRPQFIKLAPISRELRKRGYNDSIFHTGQHYDVSMSDIFFEELEIPNPVVNLNIGSGSHAYMTAHAMIGIEEELLKVNPDLVFLYGDTDTTLAGALATAKLGIPIVHIESGTRTFNLKNPEEQNRIITDNLSNWLFCPDKPSLSNLRKEALDYKAFFCGDVMYDEFQYIIHKKRAVKQLEIENINNFVLMTWHRQENTSSKEHMEKILNMIEGIGKTVVCPLHPRTRNKLIDFELINKAKNIENLKLIPPVGYFDMVFLMDRCQLIITDSGGVSKESSFAGAKCLFMVNLDVWRELQDCGWIKHIDFNDPDYIHRVKEIVENSERIPVSECPRLYGDGNAAVKIIDTLVSFDVL